MLDNKQLYSPHKLSVDFNKRKLQLYIGYKNVYQFHFVTILVKDGILLRRK
jgi:hypothetical protein